MKVFHRIRNLIVLGAVVLCALLLNTLPARAQGQLIGEWPVPGQPYGLAVQAPDVIWATLPSENALVRLVLAPGGGATATTFSVPTANSHPYHIAYAANDIWFTERNGNKIGRLSLTSGTWTEYPIPTAASQPAGLAVMPGLPTRVWFAESASNRLGLLTVADTGAFSFGEYPVPWPDAKPEELVLHGSDVWFTAAGAGRVARLRPSLWPNELAWANFGAGVGSQPWAIDIDGGGYPWFTERQTHRVGVYSPQTFGDIKWFPPPTPQSNPYDIAVRGETVAFAQRATDRLALLNIRRGSIRELSIPGSGPTSIAFDGNGCIWAAGNSAGKLLRWCAPYFRYTYLPLTQQR